MIAEHRYALVNKGNQCVVMWSNDLGFLLTLSEEIVKQGGFDLRIVEIVGYDGNGGISDEYPDVLSDTIVGDEV